MKTKPTPSPTTGNDRKALHAYLDEHAHDQWHKVAAEHGVSASALLQALAPELSDLLDADEVLVKAARAIDATRRRRAR